MFMKGLNPFLNKSGIIRNCSELLPSQAYLSPAELRRVRRGPWRPRREPRSLALVVAEEAEIIICELIFRLLALLATLASFPASKLASLSTAGMLITVLLSLDGTPLSVPAHNDTMNTLHYIVNIISSTRKVHTNGLMSPVPRILHITQHLSIYGICKALQNAMSNINFAIYNI